MGLLDRLKQLDVDKLSLDDAVELAVDAKALRAEYERRTLPVPEVLDDSLRSLDRDIEARRRDALELRLKEVRRQRAATMSAEEKRQKLAAEEADLEALLSGK